jgi:hypothetical protein
MPLVRITPQTATSQFLDDTPSSKQELKWHIHHNEYRGGLMKNPSSDSSQSEL